MIGFMTNFYLNPIASLAVSRFNLFLSTNLSSYMKMQQQRKEKILFMFTKWSKCHECVLSRK